MSNKNNSEDVSRVEGASIAINHPSHYQHIKIAHKGEAPEKYEAADISTSIIKSLGLSSAESVYLWLVLKYILRAPYKDTLLSNFEKSAWYLSRLIDEIREEEDLSRKSNLDALAKEEDLSRKNNLDALIKARGGTTDDSYNGYKKQ